MENIIEAKSITKYYGNILAVKNASFSVNRGEIYCLLGSNGAGKSTILKLLLGLSLFGEKDSGEIKVAGLNVKCEKEIAAARSIIGYVPEEKVLIEDLTGGEYVDLMAELHRSHDADRPKRKRYLLDLFKLEKRQNHLIRFYSNGMKKKVMLIGALIHNPQILVVDEPFAGLDPESIYILKNVFVELSKKGCAVILSSHNLKIVEDICNRLIILNSGRVLYEGTKKGVLEKCRARNLEESYLNLIRGSDEVKKINDRIRDIPYANQSLEEPA